VQIVFQRLIPSLVPMLLLETRQLFVDLSRHLEKGFPVGFTDAVHRLIKFFMILFEVKKGPGKGLFMGQPRHPLFENQISVFVHHIQMRDPMAGVVTGGQPPLSILLDFLKANNE